MKTGAPGRRPSHLSSLGAGRGHPRLAALAVGFVTMAASVFLVQAADAQQTIFSVPSADVLEVGRVYLEQDTLWRPQSPSFATFTLRAVAGLGDSVEAGVNAGGFTSPGPSEPTATLTVKWQPVRTPTLAVTAGAFGLLYLRGAEDGRPSAQVYAHAALVPAEGIRLTIGGWVAGRGYAATDATNGVLAAFEARVSGSLTLQADWYSGDNALGYFTPGVAISHGPWAIYAGYSFANGDPGRSAALVEIGRTF